MRPSILLSREASESDSRLARATGCSVMVPGILLTWFLQFRCRCGTGSGIVNHCVSCRGRLPLAAQSLSARRGARQDTNRTFCKDARGRSRVPRPRLTCFKRPKALGAGHVRLGARCPAVPKLRPCPTPCKIVWAIESMNRAVPLCPPKDVGDVGGLHSACHSGGRSISLPSLRPTKTTVPTRRSTPSRPASRVALGLAGKPSILPSSLT